MGGVLVPPLLGDHGGTDLMLIGVLPFFWILPRAVSVLRDGQEGGKVRALVMRGIEGIAVYNGVLALTFGGGALGLLALGLILPGRWVGRWFYST